MIMKESAHFRSARRFRGQSLAEFALMAPLLFLILAAVLELGLLFSQYLAGTDATRNATRFSSDSDFSVAGDTEDCQNTTDFYRQTACLAIAELADESPTISLCLPGSPVTRTCQSTRGWDWQDDIIISVFSVTRAYDEASDPITRGEIQIVRFPDNDGVYGEKGWSYAVDLVSTRSQSDDRTWEDPDPPSVYMHKSFYSTDDVRNKLGLNNLNGGFMLVEIHYYCYQLFAMPWFTPFVPDPVLLKFYSFWPLTSAEPTSS
jgi:hypothetical protein